MALMERTMTDKNLAAHQQNAQHSHGAATSEGKERARAANLRHGYYSQRRGEALAALGEDPELFAALVEGTRAQYCPVNAYQEWLTERMASLQWRILRSERMQENLAISHVQRLETTRRESARKLRERWAKVEDVLDSVRRAVARPDFYTPGGCFEHIARVMGQTSGADMTKILELLHRLRKPRHFSKPAPAPLPEAMSDQEWQENRDNELAWQRIQKDKGNDLTVPHPEIPVAEGTERDPLRQQLWHLAGEELRQAREIWQSAIAAQEAPLTTSERDDCLREITKELDLMRREERSCQRERANFRNEMRQLQKAAGGQDRQGKGKDRSESAAGSRGQSDAQIREEVTPVESAVVVGEDEEVRAKNEGASGYVHENTSDCDLAAATQCPPTGGTIQPEVAKLVDMTAEPASGPSAAVTSLSPDGAQGDKKLDLEKKAA